MKKKILLVHPKRFSPAYGGFEHVFFLTRFKGMMLPSSAATVAALTLPDFDVRIVDEHVEQIDYSEHYDIVGFSGFPLENVRAEEIAREFRKQGSLIVCGGPGVSVRPDGWRFADVLIIGEAERIWPEFLRDYLKGSYKSEYREEERFDLSISPVPDYSGFNRAILSEYMGATVQTSRGCPFDCDYCNVLVYVGRGVRCRQVDPVMQQLEQIYSLGIRMVLLVDDNFGIERTHALSLLKAIRDWNRTKRVPMSFTTSVSIHIGKDEELLELCAAAGLTRLVVGIESVNTEALKEVNKQHNLRNDIQACIKTIHEHGIQVAAGAMVGFDSDDLSIFSRQLEYYTSMGIPDVRVYPLQALEGTRLKERMIEEGRYIDWEQAVQDAKTRTGQQHEARGNNIFSIRPKQMTVDQLQQGVDWLLWRLYQPDAYSYRQGIFFENYARSPKRKQLEIPRTVPTRRELEIVGRILKYSVRGASSEERKMLQRSVRAALRSRHPQGLSHAIGGFLTSKAFREQLLQQDARIRDITYPRATPKSVA